MTYEACEENWDEDGLRSVFWHEHPEWAKYEGLSQNNCPADVRMAWCDFIWHMVMRQEISEALAKTVTL